MSRMFYKFSVFLLLGVFVGSLAGCTKKPDFDQLRADLEKELEENRGNTAAGNADIYAITSLRITNAMSKGKKYIAIEYKGEVECKKGFYMSEDGKYSVKKPLWRARRHVTKGTLIEFTGSMTYELTENGWRRGDNTSAMSIKHAPRI